MANPQHAILTNLTKYQWYTHMSRAEGADLAASGSFYFAPSVETLDAMLA